MIFMQSWKTDKMEEKNGTVCHLNTSCNPNVVSEDNGYIIEHVRPFFSPSDVSLLLNLQCDQTIQLLTKQDSDKICHKTLIVKENDGMKTMDRSRPNLHSNQLRINAKANLSQLRLQGMQLVCLYIYIYIDSIQGLQLYLSFKIQIIKSILNTKN